ncbi:MAG TPA: hypothetical protein VFI73_01605 [Candidatus Nitrosopolaris sp.]|nr:hypothetical protein [Candidatus Nitrosopolaris sp.]
MLNNPIKVLFLALIIVISLSLPSLFRTFAPENLHTVSAEAKVDTTYSTYIHPNIAALASIPPFFMFPQQDKHPSNLPQQMAIQGTMSKGTINSVIKTPTAEWIASGNWTLKQNDGNTTDFKTDMTWFNNNGKTSHTHQFQNFRSTATNTTGGNVTAIVQPGSNVILNGLMDVGTNQHIVWKNVPTTISIHGGKTITISVADNATNRHFAGQPIFGLVNSFTRVSK